MRTTALAALVVGAMLSGASLFGIVSTESVRSAAEAQASKVAGVSRVQNLLEVVPAANKKRGETMDATIRRDLDRVLKSHAGLRNVNVVVRGGIVRLTGARRYEGLGDVQPQPVAVATARALPAAGEPWIR